MTKILEEIHPGEILLHEFMLPMGVSELDLAEKGRITLATVKAVIDGKQPVTPEIAIALKDVFLVEPIFWTNLQSEYDLRVNQLSA